MAAKMNGKTLFEPHQQAQQNPNSISVVHNRRLRKIQGWMGFPGGTATLPTLNSEEALLPSSSCRSASTSSLCADGVRAFLASQRVSGTMYRRLCSITYAKLNDMSVLFSGHCIVSGRPQDRPVEELPEFQIFLVHFGSVSECHVE